MERKIGEIFEYNGEWYQCVEVGQQCCSDCAFHKLDSICHSMKCSLIIRSDETSVIFKKLEKVGEPYRRWLSPFNNIMVQRYRLYGRNVIMPDEPIMLLEPNYKNSVEIEIKQNKEDMGKKNQDIIEVNGKKYKFIPLETRDACTELYAFRNLDYEECLDIPCNSKDRKDGHNGYFIEVPPEEIAGKIVNEVMKNVKHQIKKNMETSKLKPFSLEAAKAGKPVCTRDGRKAIFLTTLSNKNFPVVAIVCCGQEENVYQYDINGVCDEHDDNLDLMMLPEKKEGWVNLYRKDNHIITSKDVFCSEGGAIECVDDEGDGEYYISTIKISWEE